MSEKTKQSLGGEIRARVLTADQRKMIASKAAKIRWENDAKLPKAEYRGEIVIGDIRIPCAVLDNGMRIVSERGIRGVLGPSGGNSYALKKAATDSGANLPVFLVQKQLKPYINKVFGAAPITPTKYKNGRNVLQGYSAESLPKICDVWLKAREDGALQKRQHLVAAKAETLMRGLAHIGVIALVDEATGYQKVRQRRALEKILEKFIANELMSWTKQFPDDFYDEIIRLKEWGYRPDGRYPSVVGHYTNNFIYARLAPGILDELRRLTPKDNKGRRKNRFHQWLTKDIGHPVLQEHLTKVITLMRASTSWEQFKQLADRVIPKYGEFPLPLDVSGDDTSLSTT